MEMRNIRVTPAIFLSHSKTYLHPKRMSLVLIPTPKSIPTSHIHMGGVYLLHSVNLSIPSATRLDYHNRPQNVYKCEHGHRRVVRRRSPQSCKTFSNLLGFYTCPTIPPKNKNIRTRIQTSYSNSLRTTMHQTWLHR
jgi:hypothetical protein